jgi:hypothetical protein
MTQEDDIARDDGLVINIFVANLFKMTYPLE